MAGAAAVGPRDMQDFVKGLFRGSPDLSILTHAIVRKKYLVHVGQESLTKEEKEQLKRLVEEQLLQMKADDSPGDGELMTEGQAAGKSGSHKRLRCTSSSSDGEVKSKQEQKKQRTNKKLVSSDEEDSGIDSKKIPLHGRQKHAPKFSSSSDQGDSGAEGHTDGSGNNWQSAGNKRREKRKANKSAQRLHVRRQKDRSESESEGVTDEQQSDSEEISEDKGAAKGEIISFENEGILRHCKTEKSKGCDKEGNLPGVQGLVKDRKIGKQKRTKECESEEDGEPSKVKKITGKKSESEEERSGINKVKKQTWKTQVESEDERRSGAEERPRMPGKVANPKQIRKSGSAKELGSHSENKRQPKQGGMKKTHRRNMSGKVLADEQEVKKQGKPKASVSSEESESEIEKCQGLEQKKKGMQKPSSSEDDAESGVDETGKSESKARRISLSSNESESGAEESESGNQRKKRVLEKKSKAVSGSESSQEEELPKKKGTQKSQMKVVSNSQSDTDSEDSGNELVVKKNCQGQQKARTGKPQRKSSKEELENESVKEEESSSSEDEENSSSFKQRHTGKGKDHNSGKREEHSSVQRLKRYIRECGVHRNYKKLLAGCRSRKAQVEVLKRELENLGLKGTPSLAKCKAVKQKREEAAEVASLDINNIITTEGRPRRRNVWSLYSKPLEPPSSPEEPPVRRRATDWSHLRGVISSDGESD
ncbi:HIRA-interacting protein 3 isoform X2 [Varanus komodoensis]|uniref:HIRA-interacting protein 3 isoform X2 n=1 Tax=Varanus komodoensis TaxID=61221 RepID=UPI001CF79C05|nr:HIRA-interacting protein 3 isoform X2 [Varanus komodoensis]